MNEQMQRVMDNLSNQWVQALARANQDIALLLEDNRTLKEENKELKNQLNKQEDSSK